MEPLRGLAGKKHLRVSGSRSPKCVFQESMVTVEDLNHHDKRRVEKMKEEVGNALQRAGSCPRDAIKQVDLLHQLGVAHHFEDASTVLLDRVAESIDDEDGELFDVSLPFRVLRHRGYDVSQGKQLGPGPFPCLAIRKII